MLQPFIPGGAALTSDNVTALAHKALDDTVELVALDTKRHAQTYCNTLLIK